MTYNAREELVSERLSFPGWRCVERETEYFDDGKARREVITVRDAADLELERLELERVMDEWGRLGALKLGGADLFRWFMTPKGSSSERTFLTASRSSSVTTHSRGERAGTSAPTASTGRPEWTGSSTAGVSSGKKLSPLVRNGLERTYEYDERGFLDSAADELSTSAYTYSAAGIPDWISDSSGERKLERRGNELEAGGVTYAFDELGRVTSRGGLELFYGPTGQLEAAEQGTARWEFVYDEAGNRLVKLALGRPVVAYPFGGYLDEKGFALPIEIGGRVVGLVRGGELELLETDLRGTLLGESGEPNVPTPYGVRADIRSSRPSWTTWTRATTRTWARYGWGCGTTTPISASSGRRTRSSSNRRPNASRARSSATSTATRGTTPSGMLTPRARGSNWLGIIFHWIRHRVSHWPCHQGRLERGQNRRHRARRRCGVPLDSCGDRGRGGGARRPFWCGTGSGREGYHVYVRRLSPSDPGSNQKAEQIQAAREVNGNSRLSTRAQHGYEIVDTTIGEVVKTGVSGGRRTAGGGSARANSQANRWNREAGQPGRYEPRVVQNVPAGPGARQRILEWEAENAARLREAGQLSTEPSM